MSKLNRTLFYERHVELGANIVDFAGWEMPVQYPGGIVAEHLATREQAGLFDVSHMGRFIVSGSGALSFLQHVLANNAAALEESYSQYTMICNANGGAIDDAYLYRFVPEEYLLVVNASNRQKDWDHIQAIIKDFPDVQMEDRTEDFVMLSLQGPRSRAILNEIIDSGVLPEPERNRNDIVTIGGARVLVARTGYTGEPICFELFIERSDGLKIWDLLTEKGATPIGLGARDTLRLEAGLPLYGHELGTDPEGKEIPVFACGLAKVAVSFSPLKGDFIGKTALLKQFEAFKLIQDRDYSRIGDLPQSIKPLVLLGRGVARAGAKVYRGEEHVGYITSGTMVPYWKVAGKGLETRYTDEKGMRSVCLALIPSDLWEDDQVQVEIRGKKTEAVIMPYHLRTETPPYTQPIIYDLLKIQPEKIPSAATTKKVGELLQKTLENTIWRQRECINLIPSEMTQSVMTRRLSVMDAVGRYAEHKQVKAYYDADVFYYQGTEFIHEVETLLEEEICKFLGCREAETRLISGQMANTAVFSAMVDFLNRADRKSEQRRIRKIMNNHIIKGGHLSAQPMGALRDFVQRDPQTERPAVVNFPVLQDNPYKIDVEACLPLLEEHKPELIIFGKSMVLHKEPVAEIRKFVDDLGLKCYLMYDMSHVLGLTGPNFQEPFAEGADMVTGSTHKTFFGTQRGIVAADWDERDVGYDLWEAIRRRAFPGSVSNHHLGTLVGLLMAAYEMNHFKEPYQKKVMANAKAFARALHECGLDVAGDPSIDYTETHQVIVNVGYAHAPEVAQRLEENNIIVNYQASPTEESFSAAGSLRMGVSEMTRFGMEAADFQTLASLIRDLVIENKSVKENVKTLRERFLDLRFCFAENEFTEVMQKLHSFI
jgi:aminomethyltransferase